MYNSRITFELSLKFYIILSAFLVNVLFGQNLLRGPQKIVQDKVRNRMLVSNYPSGALVQIDSSGNQSYFVQFAGFIDGLDIYDGIVYGVANGRRIKAYDLDTGQSVFNVRLGGLNSDYLSSITADSTGHLFISCPRENIIYKMRISDQSYWVFAEGNGLNGPNGILLERENNRILIVNEVLDSSEPTAVLAIDLADSTVSTATTLNLNRPDGIAKDKNGYYYIGGYYLPALYRLNPDFGNSPEAIYFGSHMVYPTYNKENHSLLVTHYDDNDWSEFFIEELGIDNKSNTPDKYILLQNYPNPFNPSTNIEYILNEDSITTITIRDLNGNIVRNLKNEFQYAGKNVVAWNGKDNTGNFVGAGLYFCQLEAGDFIENRKMMLLK